MRKTLLIFLLITTFFVSYAFAQAEVSQRLSNAMLDAQKSNSPIRTLVVLQDQVDIRALDKQLYAQKATLEERAFTVITTLQEKANRTQGDLEQFLNSKYQDEVIQYEKYWITNMFFVEAKTEVLLDLAKRSDVSFMDLDAELTWDKPVSREPAASKSVNGHEIGLERINAHLMWKAGFTGDGRVVMNDDTGVDGNHPALSYKWRGALPGVPASAAWKSYNGSTSFPVDGDGHGTHTMGTMCGLDPATNDTVGVAPGATWIASDGLWGSPHTSYSIAAWQWAVDPDNNPSTIDDMPDAIGNSWYDPAITIECDAAQNPYINAYQGVEAAGIAIIFSAGNSGPGSTSITSPKNVNYDEVSFWATGALDGNNASLPIASFSSRGPVIASCNTGVPSLDIKPEASAPGVSVRSSTGGSYSLFSGTSMAAPHVVGAIALLREAHPSITGWEAKMALYQTAVDLGDPGEDNNYGMGIIDVWAAHMSLADPDDPNPPTDFATFSDYSTPTSMLLSWVDPVTYSNGDSLTNFQLYVYRDGNQVGTVPMGTETFTDNGLTDGDEYEYSIMAADIPNDSLSMPVFASWYAGGHPVPSPPMVFYISQATTKNGDLMAHWTNPAVNVDGTMMDDFDAINLYEDGSLLTTFTRTSSDTGAADSAFFTPNSGTHQYYITAVDNENPANESDASNTAFSPIGIPFFEDFPVAGVPNAAYWLNSNGEVSNLASNPPSPDYALEVDGNPSGDDEVTLLPVDLSGASGMGYILSYWYQPQGNANAPETSDSLFVEFKNDLGNWVTVRRYGGSSVVPFMNDIVSLDGENAGSGASFFHPLFQLRFRTASSPTGNYDEWFIDDVFLGEPSNDPIMAVTPTAVGDTLLIGDTSVHEVMVKNEQGLPSTLTYTVTENPDVAWLTVTPVSGSVASNQADVLELSFDATGLTQGLHETTLEIDGSDPNNPQVVVNVSLYANESPVISIVPDSFYVQASGANAVVDTMKINNTGNGLLDFTISTQDLTKNVEIKVLNDGPHLNPIVEAPAGVRNLLPQTRTLSNESTDDFPGGLIYEDELRAGSGPLIQVENTEDLYYIGGTNSSFSGTNRDRGNFYEITEKVKLKEQLYYLNMSGSGDLYHFVYEGTSMSGTYNLVSIIQVNNQGPGEGWYESGPVNLTLYEGNYYYIGCAWSVSSTYYTGVGPFTLPWGNHLYGQPSTKAGYPPAASVVGPTSTNNTGYYQALDIATTADWIAADPLQGTVAGNSSADIVVTFDPTGLLGGDYFGNIIVNSNDPVNPIVSAGVQMHVTGEPGAAVNPDMLDYGDVFTGDSETMMFYVKNIGSDSLHVTDISTYTGEFSVVSPTAFTLAIDDSMAVEVEFTSGTVGTYQDSVMVTSDATNMVPKVMLYANVVDPPVIAVSDTLLDGGSLYVGETDSTMFYIYNNGSYDLDYSLVFVEDAPVEATRTAQPTRFANNWNRKSASVTSTSAALEKAPASSRSAFTPTSKAPWDLLFSHDVSTSTGGTGIAGAEFDGTNFYVCEWGYSGIYNTIYKLDMNGNMVSSFTAPTSGAGFRDLAFDGTNLFGSNASTTLYEFDGNGNVIGTITSPVNVRALAYDSDNDAFWAADWSTDIYLFDRNGNTLATLPAATHGLGGMYGMAYDPYSDGGPYLWVFDQGSGAGFAQYIVQLDATTGAPTGVAYDVMQDLVSTDAIAGGLFITTEYMPGKAVLGGLLQGTPNLLFGYELTDAAGGWLTLDHTEGSVMPGDSAMVKVFFNGVLITSENLVEGDIQIHSNDPVNPQVDVHAMLDIVGSPNIAVSPGMLDFGTVFTTVAETLAFNITNTGSDILDVSSISTSTAEFSVVGATSMSIGIGASEMVEVEFLASSAGSYEDSVVVASNAPGGDVSVQLMGTANDPGVIGVSQDSVFFSLVTNQVDSAVVQLQNNGSGPLEIIAIEDEEPSAKAAYRYVQPQAQRYYYDKGQPELSFGVQTEGAGGPDPFGYSWIDSDEPNGPAYTFTDISGTGTMATLTATGTFDPYDEGMATITLPWPVKFYGDSYTELQVNTNGFITFDMSYFANSFTNQGIPLADVPNSVIAAFWDDLDGRAGGQIYYQQIGNKFIIQWHNWGHYSQGTENMIFQIVLFQNSSTYHLVYEHVVDDAGATYGIENQDGTVGLQIAYNMMYGHDQLLVRISKGIDWLTENPTSGTIPAGGTLDLKLKADATGLTGGEYLAQVLVTSNDPVTPVFKKPIVKLEVTGAPDIAVDPMDVIFGPLFTGVYDTMQFKVINSGTDVLDVTGMTTGGVPEFTVLGPTAFTLGVGDEQWVDVEFMSAMPGMFADTVTISSNAASGDAYVYLAAEALDPPVIDVSDTSMVHSVAVGQTDSSYLWVYNNGGSDLEFDMAMGETPFMSKTAKLPEQPSNTIGVGYNEVSPKKTAVPASSFKAPWDLQFNYDVATTTGGTGIAGAEFDGTYFYVSEWGYSGIYNTIYKLDINGNLVSSFPAPMSGAGIRDLAFDGTNLFGSNASTTIYEIDGSGNVMGTFPSPVNVRAIAYDEDNDAFWAADWSTDIYLVDRAGNTLASIPAASHGLGGMYGMAYDNISSGGPYLWVFDQGAGAGFAQYIVQIDIATGTPTGVSYDVTQDLVSTDAIAGGLFITTDYASGTATIGGLLQGTPDLLFGYELAPYSTWVTMAHNHGVVEPGDSLAMKMYFHGVETTEGTYEGWLGIFSNDPVDPIVNVHMQLEVVTGLEDLVNAIPTKFALHQNYPNPFNPTTTIKYDLAENRKVTLKVYNMLGQVVRTLVDDNQTAGFKKVVWDGLNETGQRVSTGIYFYRIEAGKFVKTQKMILMK